MVTRLTPRDATFYALESTKNPIHIGSLMIVDNAAGALDYEKLLALVESRLPEVPRYRQKIREVPFGLGRPVWVDDREFDITYHIRRSALPKPGSDDQLDELVARLASRPLDPSRPLWEMYLVEGLSGDRMALFTKTHAALADGIEALEICHVILEAGEAPPPVDQIWMPAREPSGLSLIGDALVHMASRPTDTAESVRRFIEEASVTAGDVAKTLAGYASVLGTATGSAPTSPLNATVSRNRRFDVVRTNLEDYRKIRSSRGGSINDVILAVISGALRNWLMSRGEPITESTTLRAIVPMSVYLDATEDLAMSEVTSFLVDLPVGEPNPAIRLSHIAHATEARSRVQRGVTAPTLVRLSGFAPASLHAMSVRAASTYAQRAFNLVITNMPGPQAPMYLAGARMLDMFPVSPLLRNQALTIGLTSYDGSVNYGLNADRDAMADVDVVTALLYESMEELLDVCS
ncbi:WS/DGAT/MGAT family O-acyltransferase [Aldersonia kunmingensis]|uniref:WS/DGAT/MGAT family O-acyltransferase n=1 Tax=Aldersonia kunmingensis TaxID=408066 RepID=UPI000830F503|nr:wax ester/triacylglycerol synthase family O-acyltransferase [Aldersonia kunmingensis]